MFPDRRNCFGALHHFGPCLLEMFLAVVPDRKWVAYSKLYQSLEVDSSVLFQQLTSIEYHWHQQELPYQQVGPPNSLSTDTSHQYVSSLDAQF